MSHSPQVTAPSQTITTTPTLFFNSIFTPFTGPPSTFSAEEATHAPRAEKIKIILSCIAEQRAKVRANIFTTQKTELRRLLTTADDMLMKDLGMSTLGLTAWELRNGSCTLRLGEVLDRQIHEWLHALPVIQGEGRVYMTREHKVIDEKLMFADLRAAIAARGSGSTPDRVRDETHAAIVNLLRLTRSELDECDARARAARKMYEEALTRDARSQMRMDTSTTADDSWRVSKSADAIQSPGITAYGDGGRLRDIGNEGSQRPKDPRTRLEETRFERR